MEFKIIFFFFNCIYSTGLAPDVLAVITFRVFLLSKKKANKGQFFDIDSNEYWQKEINTLLSYGLMRT